MVLPRPKVTIAPPVVKGDSVTIAYTVNRAATQVTDRDCLLRSDHARVSRGCGTRTATSATSTTYQATFAGLAPGRYRYSVSVDVRHGSHAEASATFTVAPVPVNHAPVAVDDRFAVVSGGTVAVQPPGVLANDTDADGDPLTAVLASPPTHGALTLNPAGSLTYVPNAGFIGTDAFTYRANDGKAMSNLAAVTITVAGPPPNRAPVAVDQTYTVETGRELMVAQPSLLIGASDPDGDPLSVVLPLVTQPAHGQAGVSVPASNPALSYSSSGGFVGTDTFTYQDRDDHGNLSNIATVTIIVTGPPPNRAPVAVDQTYTVQSGRELMVAPPSLLIGASDPDGDPLSVVLPLVTQPAHGQAAVAIPTSNPALGYASSVGFVGTDTFTYQVRDDHGNLSNIATVTITVTP